MTYQQQANKTHRIRRIADPANNLFRFQSPLTSSHGMLLEMMSGWDRTTSWTIHLFIFPNTPQAGAVLQSCREELQGLWWEKSTIIKQTQDLVLSTLLGLNLGDPRGNAVWINPLLLSQIHISSRPWTLCSPTMSANRAWTQNGAWAWFPFLLSS